MKKAYIYPNPYKKKEDSNPYLHDFVDSLSKKFVFVNKSKPSQSGIFDLLKYINKIDIAFFHWIEDLPDKKGGIMQAFLFFSLILIFKFRKIKIFYTLHNKDSHYQSHLFLKRIIRKVILRYADFIIFHSSEGLKLNENIRTRNIKYIPHPFRTQLNPDISTAKHYDLLIWGAIRPYKGITEFLAYLQKSNLLDSYKTLIIGKIFPSEYETELMKYKSENIKIENKYIDDLTLNNLIAKTRIVLFTYNEKSVLSSGALVYSLSQGAFVIGPKTGAFRDLHSEGITEVFETFDDLIPKIDYYLKQPNLFLDKTSSFIKKNSWDAFGSEISAWIDNQS